MLMWLWNMVIGKIDFQKIDIQQFKDTVSSLIPKLTDEQKKMLIEAAVAGMISGAMKK